MIANRIRHPLIGAAMIAVLLVAGGPAEAAPKARLWTRWTQHDSAATQVVDHRPWDAFLGKYVRTGADGINRVAYGQVTPADRARLQKYLDALQATPVSRLARPEQMAFWINLYNAATVALVLGHYPVSSIRKISGGPLALGPWQRELVRVEGVALTLDDIEHRILRPIWHDPRVHYAVNCAALGCPNLATRAYRSDRLSEMLDAAARAYINNPRGVTIRHGKLFVSSLYRWYRADFGGSAQAVITHLTAYADPRLAARLKTFRKISGYAYDWALNDAAPPTVRRRRPQ